MLWSPNLPPFNSNVRRRGEPPPAIDCISDVWWALKWVLIGVLIGALVFLAFAIHSKLN